MSPPSDVITAASSLAKVLDADPVLASQLKEHLSVERLLDLLDMPKVEVLKALGVLEDEEE